MDSITWSKLTLIELLLWYIIEKDENLSLAIILNIQLKFPEEIIKETKDFRDAYLRLK